MSAQRKTLIELVENLPPELEQEVTDFVLFVINRHNPNSQTIEEHALGSLALLAHLAEEANIDTGESDVSSHSREILSSEYADYLADRMLTKSDDRDEEQGSSR